MCNVAGHPPIEDTLIDHVDRYPVPLAQPYQGGELLLAETTCSSRPKLPVKRRHGGSSADRTSADPWTTWRGVPTGKLP